MIDSARRRAEWTARCILERCREELGGPGPPISTEYVLGCATNAVTSELRRHGRIAGVRRSDEPKHWAPTVSIVIIVAKAHQRANAILRCFVSRDTLILVVRAFNLYVRPLVTGSPAGPSRVNGVRRIVVLKHQPFAKGTILYQSIWHLVWVHDYVREVTSPDKVGSGPMSGRDLYIHSS